MPPKPPNVFQPAPGILVRLLQVCKDGVEFDLAKIPLGRSALDQLKEPVADPVGDLVRVKLTARDLAAPDVDLLPADCQIELRKQDPEGVIDLWSEYRLGLAKDALLGLVVPPCDWETDYPEPRVPVTHLAVRMKLRWEPAQELEPGAQVELKFDSIVDVTGVANERLVPGELRCVVYVEGGNLLPAQKHEADVLHEPDPPLRSSEDIQGNILAGFNKDHQVFLLLGFPRGSKPREWLKKVIARPEPGRETTPADRGIATTAEVSDFNDDYGKARASEDPHIDDLKAVWVNVAFTYEGIVQLQPLLEEKLQQEEYEAFREGPAARAALLGDDGNSAPDRWVFGGSGEVGSYEKVHTLLTVAADDLGELREEVNRQGILAARFGLKVVYQQSGDALPEPVHGSGHFGFKDGVSQPGIHDFSRELNGQDRDHPGARVVDSEQFVFGPQAPKWKVHGSFQVFRRLAQDVANWQVQISYQSERFPLNFQMRPDLLAAKLMGRWPSGTPLAQAPMRDFRPTPGREDNNFTYEGDEKGTQTPLFAHIRRMNPRNGDPHPRILRRGIPFGAVFDPAADGVEHQADAERGLLFSAFMANIEDQFEVLQRKFALDPDPFGGPDPLVGVPRDSGSCTLRRVGEEPDTPVEFTFALRRFVWTTGAVYAFVPSLPILKALAEGKPEDLGLS